MKKVAWGRRGIFALTAWAALAAVGCGSSSKQQGTREFGELRLPLSTQASSGTEYRLRNATFEITRYCYYYDYDYGCGYGYGGEGGGGGDQTITVSSEDDPAAGSIVVALEQGDYMVRLLPGWHMEQTSESGAETVEAQLLSGETTWVWISPHSTSWVEYQFGIGSKEIWLNGQLNIDINVYEDPNEYYGGEAGYGSGGSGGFANGGASSGGFAGSP